MSKLHTIQYKTYSFDELSDEAKEAAIENNRDINTNDDWHEFALEDWQEKLEDYGFINPKISYTGFWSQGDGASFTCDYVDILKVIQHINLPSKLNKNIKRILKAGDEYINIAVNRTCNHYSHESTCKAVASHNYHYTHIDQSIDELVTYIEELRIALSGDIYTSLRNEYEHLLSDESIQETLICNECEFQVDGTVPQHNILMEALV